MLDIVVDAAKKHTKVISMRFNNEIYWQDEGAVEKYRSGIETTIIAFGKKFPVEVIFNNWENSINSATNSIGTTIFVMFLLTVSVGLW